MNNMRERERVEKETERIKVREYRNNFNCITAAISPKDTKYLEALGIDEIKKRESSLAVKIHRKGDGF